jgi:FKBP-type peptidyl-prolyl cis-trans isomerase SlyD
MSQIIEDNKVATVTYRLTVDGEIIDEATADDPLEYLHGAENIVPGLEKALTGKKVGDKLTVTLQPEEAYGEYDPEDTELLDRSDLPEDIEVGMELLLEDEEGNFFEVTIKEIKGDEVVVDFNYPLAGKVVTYDVEVLEIRDADDEEIAHGHVHGEAFYDEDEDYDDEDYDDED